MSNNRYVVIRNDMQRAVGEVQSDGSVECVAIVSVTLPGDGSWQRLGVLERRAVELVRLLNLGLDLSRVDPRVGSR
jgi:hypothetical protein